MRVHSVLTVVVLSAGLQACALTARQETRTEYDACLAAADASPEATALYGRIVRNAEEAPSTEKLSDKGRLTKAEKDSLVALSAMKDRCHQIVLAYVDRHAPWQAAPFRDAKASQSNIMMELVGDEITVAQYNRETIRIGAKFKADIARVSDERQQQQDAIDRREEREKQERKDRRAREQLEDEEAIVKHRTWQDAPGDPGELGTAFLRRSYVADSNRICIYDRAGNEEHATVKSYELCPQTRD
jgi:hypothetical protein